MIAASSAGSGVPTSAPGARSVGSVSSSTNGLPLPSMRTSMSSRPEPWKTDARAPYAASSAGCSASCTEEMPRFSLSSHHGVCGISREYLLYRPAMQMGAWLAARLTAHARDGAGGGQSFARSRRPRQSGSKSALSTERTELATGSCSFCRLPPCGSPPARG